MRVLRRQRCSVQLKERVLGHNSDAQTAARAGEAGASGRRNRVDPGGVRVRVRVHIRVLGAKGDLVVSRAADAAAADAAAATAADADAVRHVRQHAAGRRREAEAEPNRLRNGRRQRL